MFPVEYVTCQVQEPNASHSSSIDVTLSDFPAHFFVFVPLWLTQAQETRWVCGLVASD